MAPVQPNRFAAHLAWIAPIAAIALFCASCATAPQPWEREEAAVTITNALVSVTVNPHYGGRIMDMRFGKSDNMLWKNKRVRTLMWKWRNHGGEKTWLGPQETWEAICGKAWPPPLTYDNFPYSVVTQNLSSITMRSKVDLGWKIVVERSVAITNDTVYVSSRLIPALPPAEMPKWRVTNWSVTQLQDPEKVYIRLVGAKRVANGMNGAPTLPEPVKSEFSDDVIAFNLRKLDETGKASFDSDMMAVNKKGGFLVMQQIGDFEDDLPEEAAPERAQFYHGGKANLPPGYTPYVEVEFAMPQPKSAQTILFRFLPYGKDPDAERRLVEYMTRAE